MTRRPDRSAGPPRHGAPRAGRATGRRRRTAGRGRRRRRRLAAAVLAFIVAFVAFQLLRDAPAPVVTGALSLHRTLPGQTPAVPWPATGQASVMIDGFGTESSPTQKPVPTASTAKIMTAYLFLRRHPLRPGEQGPTFTVSAEEAARYPARLAEGQSLTLLTAGERFTERRALQALLTVSANNLADEVARWNAGSQAAFVTEMNQAARSLGMDHTTYTDPTGLQVSTVSTPADQVKLFSAALKLPEFGEVAGSASYTDSAGVRHSNTNPLLGTLGVFAGKTGSTSAAGMNLVLAAHREIDGADRLVVVAVMAQPASQPLVRRQAATALLHATDGSLVTAPVIRAGETVARLDDRQGLTAAGDLDATGRPGARVTVTIEPTPALPPHAPAGTTAGRALAPGRTGEPSSVPLVTAPMPPSSLVERLTNGL